ncbi:MAG: hypothetical protein HZC40_17145 [Chloroflexi bacterium]|nr:hypothetical protein [Chloroflexota bacterium]
MNGTLITIAVPEQAMRRANDVAARTHQRVEEVLTRWLDWAAEEIPVETLPDDDLLVLCEMQMSERQQQELSDLLAENREGLLDSTHQTRLDELMQIYRRGLVRKAQAIQVAVRRGLRASLYPVAS